MSTPSPSLVVSQATAILAGKTSGIIFATFKKQAKNAFPSLRTCPTDTFSIIARKVLAINELSDPDTTEDGAHTGSGLESGPRVVKLEIHLHLNSSLGKHPQPVAALRGVNVTTDESGVTTIGQRWKMHFKWQSANPPVRINGNGPTNVQIRVFRTRAPTQAKTHRLPSHGPQRPIIILMCIVIAKWNEFARASQAAVLVWPIFIVVRETLVPLIAQVGGDRGSRDRKYLRDALKKYGIGKPHLKATTLVIEAEDVLENCDLNRVKAAVDRTHARGVENCVEVFLEEARVSCTSYSQPVRIEHPLGTDYD
ncbi:hypothetical protein DFJ58DRAFT_911941 [Suillus subalutaceus]|uniref:uncharacterized protein n=1 Tax=Suillus subalutaceus TaxID=48586 RepID=UPI001B85CD8F|nr:uncharacterized protein DFJ58DRAFT_911941 [Suillus subalutaceus]KAG1865465.1 hypothetical protein DFJ58DRAFT_911941 [Suillus subalutaceus]